MNKTCVSTQEPTKAMFILLLLLLPGDAKHGYALLTESAAIAQGEFNLTIGTLYRSLAVMMERGWVHETGESYHDKRRRFYQITKIGAQVFQQEAEHLQKLLRFALSVGQGELFHE